VEKAVVRQSLIALAALVAGCGRPGVPVPSEEPPPAPREFRAAWVATVANIDWPSRRDLSSAEQKAEITRIVDRAAELHLNALVLQVRTSADALYPSKLEPWSEYLTGEQGRPPEPFYDPLRTWIAEAHQRGLELHAWFNPYRARHPEAKSPNAPNHIASTHPEAVKTYGGYLWMDPASSIAADETLAVVLDVVHRYDVDGVHIDDYFYPYPEKDQDFPDDAAYQAYQESGGALDRAGFRRQNVSRLIERLYTGIHQEKRWVKFGISPFGVGRPDRRPPGVSGFSQYDKLYADVEGWLASGWLDYLAPQLYWPIKQEHQPFGTLLDYWIGESKASKQTRHVWPGLFTSRLDGSEKSWSPDEIIGQIRVARERGPAASRGELHFSMVSLLENRHGIADRLEAGPYAAASLIPASPWLGGEPPSPPRASVKGVDGDRVTVAVAIGVPRARDAEPPVTYAIWTRTNGQWHFRALPTREASLDLPRAGLERVVVSAVDRAGLESERVHLDERSW
jgi:uncharacterized lipoprotein YddW (UPF0748 family)